jgi:hypothetical protein
MNKRFILTAALLALISTAGQAQTLPKTQLKVVGGLSNLSAYNDYEKPFWTKVVPSLSNGQITADIKGFNEMGLKGPELLRLMSQGVIEFGTATLSYFASDNPINEAVDLAGLAADAKTARAVVDAFEPVYAKYYAAGSGIKLLGLSPFLQCRNQGSGRSERKKSAHQQPHPGRVCRCAGWLQCDDGVWRSGSRHAEQGGRLRDHRLAIGVLRQVVRSFHPPVRLADQLESADPCGEPESLGQA